MANIKSCVSLYSFQDEYMNKRMSLDDIIRYVKECGAYGFEILPDQMLHGSPEVSSATKEHWDKIVSETALKPVIADVFLNTNLYKNRTLTKRECIALLVKEIEQADRLGIRMLRLVSMIPYWVIEPLLPYCEKHDVTIALEIHAGMAFDEVATAEFIKEMKRVNSKYVGLVVDTGIFCRKFPRVVRAYESQNGSNPEIFDYMDALFAKGSDFHKVIVENRGLPEDIKPLLKTSHDKGFIYLCDGYENRPFSEMDDLIPYIKHFHLKMFDMTDEGPEYSMDYRALIEYLNAKGWSGYLSTEYEGNRWTLPGKPMQEKEQVRRNVEYVNKCIKEICN